MREIKFRFWSINERKMLHNEHPYVDVNYFNLINGHLWAYEVMQYTGLKDKNGKEIFEGDVLMTLWGDSCSGVVEYNAQYAVYNFVCKERNFTYDFIETQSDEYEIIGNIHENPELIEVDE